MKPIVEVNGLWKEYQRGAQKEKYLSLRDSVFKGFSPRKKKEKFWALQDVNFEVFPGDSLAIIGKNGAGKSTLLKILSRITPPTKGEIILRGRLASLLEVGTGFHAELTGRENIYLNGSILGLKKSEIEKQFDAIVDFSGVEAFLDTPLKHYSSGMQLRLAFAVAAHLEPEILVIDEVLAVGDSAFQQKCIEKMTEVSHSGRTLLFVSHNVAAVRNLCASGILLKNGKLHLVGGVDDILNEYFSRKVNQSKSTKISLIEAIRKPAKGELVFDYIHARSWTVFPGEDLILEMSLKSLIGNSFKDLLFGVNIMDDQEQCIYHLSNIFLNIPVPEHADERKYTFRVENINLRPGTYTGSLFLRANEEVQDWIMNAFTLTVAEGNIYQFNNSSMIQGKFQPKFQFSF